MRIGEFWGPFPRHGQSGVCRLCSDPLHSVGAGSLEIVLCFFWGVGPLESRPEFDFGVHVVD